MIGIDLLHLPRLSSVLLRQRSRYVTRFARRILTPGEFEVFQRKLLEVAASRTRDDGSKEQEQEEGEWEGQISSSSSSSSRFEWRGSGEKSPLVRWLGTRWAAKEAAFKAGGAGRRLLWKDVEVRLMHMGKKGQPYLYLTETGATGQLSISHDGEYVVAMAFIPPTPVAAAFRGVAGVGLGAGLG
ncbi:hypothetical protein RUND412_001596 [Rhizina undulata]